MSFIRVFLVDKLAVFNMRAAAEVVVPLYIEAMTQNTESKEMWVPLAYTAMSSIRCVPTA